jgi:hypothetical protein
MDKREKLKELTKLFVEATQDWVREIDKAVDEVRLDEVPGITYDYKKAVEYWCSAFNNTANGGWYGHAFGDMQDAYYLATRWNIGLAEWEAIKVVNKNYKRDDA